MLTKLPAEKNLGSIVLENVKILHVLFYFLYFWDLSFQNLQDDSGVRSSQQCEIA